MATVSKSITVSEQGAYTVELDIIPTGSTVTPVNNIQTWLKCAAIWDKTYTTITQVLADASTLQALIASNNAADYMARSTDWASSVVANSNAMTYIGVNNYCANKLLANSTWRNAICNSTYFENVLNVKVPTMTSNTAPYGEVVYNDLQSGDAYKVFDGSTSTVANMFNYNTSDANHQNSYIGYKFLEPVKINKVSFIDRYADVNYGIIGIKIYGSNIKSNNRNDWTLLHTQTKETTVADFSFNFENDTAYEYYEVQIAVNGTSNLFGGFKELQFYGRA